MTENNIDDLRKARYMSFSCPPASPEAKSLVDEIIDIITKSEKRQRARKADGAHCDLKFLDYQKASR